MEAEWSLAGKHGAHVLLHSSTLDYFMNFHRKANILRWGTCSSVYIYSSCMLYPSTHPPIVLWLCLAPLWAVYANHEDMFAFVSLFFSIKMIESHTSLLETLQ